MKRDFGNPYLRYFFSYPVILLLPLIFPVFTVDSYLLPVYIDSLLDKKLSISEQAAVNAQITRMDSFAYQIGKNPEFSMNRLKLQRAILWERHLEEPTDGDCKVDTDVIGAVKEEFSRKDSCYAIQYAERNCFILVSAQLSNLPEICADYYRPGIDRLRKKGINAALYLGGAFPNMALLHKSFNASKALFANSPMPDKGICYHNQSVCDSEQIKGRLFSNANLRELAEAIQNENILMIKFLSRQITHYIEHDMKDPSLERCTCYNAINCVFRFSETKRPGVTKILSQDAANRFSNFFIEELLLIFKSMRSQLVVETREHVNSKKKLSMEEIPLYIDKYYDDLDMSAKTFAADCSRTMANFSHQFKNFTSKPISVYINEKRFEHTKNLWQQRDYSVADIAAQSGFTYISSSMSKFKQIEGVMPGEYQERFKNFEIESDNV